MGNRLLDKCLCCGSTDLSLVIDLGEQPPANSYSVSPPAQESRFPLGLNLCLSCWHSQLTFCVDRQLIFDEYSYVSGTSRTLDRFFVWFSNNLSQCYPGGSKVLELAANDGSLVKHLISSGFDVVGIDAAKNIVEQARSRGLPIFQGYWPDANSRLDGKFEVIICMNVVAHVENPVDFVAACASRLKEGGVLIIQPSQARMFGNAEFDTIYHEHISFFNISSMRKLAESAGLTLYGEFLVGVHGDSPVYLLGLPGNPPPISRILSAFSDGEFSIQESLEEYERKISLYDQKTYLTFQMRASAIMEDLLNKVHDFRAKGFLICFIGAAAKGFTVINACKLRPDHFLDEAPMKIGKYAPGVGIVIESLEAVRSFSRPTLFIILAWNFRNELMNKVRNFGAPKGSIFYTYFPHSQLDALEG
jgi:SAM-dependent methyltransferase